LPLKHKPGNADYLYAAFSFLEAIAVPFTREAILFTANPPRNIRPPCFGLRPIIRSCDKASFLAAVER